MSKKLVAYFSASGVTETAAKRMEQAIGADLFEIAPKLHIQPQILTGPTAKAGAAWK